MRLIRIALGGSAGQDPEQPNYCDYGEELRNFEDEDDVDGVSSITFRFLFLK